MVRRMNVPSAEHQQLEDAAQAQMDRITDTGEAQEVAMIICAGADLAAVVNLLVQKGILTHTEFLTAIRDGRKAIVDMMVAENRDGLPPAALIPGKSN